MPSIDTLDAACRDWTAAHDLIWPDGDYYIARKTIIREGVAHLKRGRRYIFVEPVLGPATSYLYPRWEDENEVVDDDMDENYEGVHEVLSTQENNYNNSNSYSNGEVGQHRPEGNDAPVVSTDAINTTDTDTRSLSFTAQALASGQSDAAHVQADVNPRFMNEQEHTPGVNETEATPATDGDGTRGDRAHLCPAMGDKGERIEKDEADDSNSRVDSNTNGSNTNSANSTPNTHTNNNISTPSPPSSSSSPSTSNTRSSTSGHANDSQPLRHPHQQQQQQPQHSRPFESLEPYSPLLDPSTDGQDQFEYGLYELQYIPKIQYLLPEQFLPTRRSFIVHLDEDRPTLASPVPAHWRRSECRCQLMMRKVLLHRDLLQVWPPIPPVRTLQERQQEAEEEARMLEIKQKVQLQSVNWRKTLMTQMVACG
ncbi:hypothetical protein BGX28_009753 [Mortierella sp. GBA30]|nr:hypothetical protein BGX28_009753 [Mortierella sp. GBA30]